MKSIVFPVALVLLVPGLAFAQPAQASDPAAAQTLFYEARQLMNAGNFPEACPKLEESMRLDAGIGTAFNLADCNEHVGKLASAWAGYLDVAAEAKSANQPDREKLARKRAAALEPKLPKLVVDVPDTLHDVTVKRDGVLIGSAAWGTAIPVDAGAHQITVTAPGKQWETTTNAVEKQVVHVPVPAVLPDAPVAEAPPLPVEPAITETHSAQPPPESTGTSQRVIGWAVAGFGVVGIGLGAGFGVASIGKRNDSRGHCTGNACDAEGVGLRNDAIHDGNISTITMIAGGAALVGGIALVLTAPKGNGERAGTIRAMPTATLGGGGMLVQGTFE